MKQSVEQIKAHCRQVGDICAEHYGEDSAEALVGYYHDYIEDGLMTLREVEDELARAGHGVDKVIAVSTALTYITRNKDERYHDYIVRCGGNAISRRVKLVDLDVNLHLRETPPNDSLKERYEKAVKCLKHNH